MESTESNKNSSEFQRNKQTKPLDLGKYKVFSQTVNIAPVLNCLVTFTDLGV